MRTILYVCVHNAGRSQMAEAFTNALARERGLPVRAVSAGTAAGSQINPVVAQVMREAAVPLDGHAPKALTPELAASADRLITMGCGLDADVCPARLRPGMEDWGLDDPKGQPIEVVRVIRDQVRRKVEALLAEIAGEDPPPVACNLGAFDAAQRERHGVVVDLLRAAARERRELADGWAFVLPSDGATCALALEFVGLERLCCPFWTFRLELDPRGGPLTLSLSGPAGAKDLLAGFLAP